MSDYLDETLVYVDPDKRKVIGEVEWTKDGSVKQLEHPYDTAADEDNDKVKKGKFRRRKKRYYPWCSYRTAKRVYRVEGKEKAEETVRTLDDVLQRALAEPYWNE